MKKLKNETALVKEAVRMIMADAEARKIAEFEPTDSAALKIEYCYRLLVHDKKIIPLANDQVGLPNYRRVLARWVARQLPKDHALLK
ncbi:MAG: DUF5062 family protein [Gammaproteobacteria bacterium]|nr:DUF5062 family protein [Gammaproteobacteria bacterium]